MIKIVYFASIAFLSVICTSIVLGLPTANQTSNVPSGDTTGGAGSLVPSYTSTAKTSADIAGDPNKTPAGFDPGLGGIMSFATDSASVDDSASQTYKISRIGDGYTVKWEVLLLGQATSKAATLNAPGNPVNGSYHTDASCNVWVDLLVNGNEIESKNEEESAVIRNNQAGSLSALAVAGLGAVAQPLVVVPLNNENGESTLSLKYGIRLGVDLSAQRDDVGVGGMASGNFSEGFVKAWGIAIDDDDQEPVLLKQKNGTDDAVWEIN